MSGGRARHVERHMPASAGSIHPARSIFGNVYDAFPKAYSRPYRRPRRWPLPVPFRVFARPWRAATRSGSKYFWCTHCQVVLVRASRQTPRNQFRVDGLA